MPRRALDDRRVIRDARLLATPAECRRCPAERDHRLARSPGRHARGGDARDALLHREAVFLQDVDEVALRLDLLKPSSAKLKIESTICCEVLHRVHVPGRLGLQPFSSRILLHRPGRLRRCRGRHQLDSLCALGAAIIAIAARTAHSSRVRPIGPPSPAADSRKRDADRADLRNAHRQGIIGIEWCD